MTGERRRELLSKLADGFEDCSCLLLDPKWLGDNNVMLHECIDLSHDVAAAIRESIA